MLLCFDLVIRAVKSKKLYSLTLSIVATILALGVLVTLIYRVFEEGWQWLDWQFLDSFPSRFPKKAGIKSAIYGSLWLGSLTLFFSVLFGVGAAIYLEELAKKTRLNHWIEVNIATLAGVPSIIYGMLGLTLFVRLLNLQRSVLAGALTLSLLIMPVIIIATREALKSVPDSIRLGAAAWEPLDGKVFVTTYYLQQSPEFLRESSWPWPVPLVKQLL